MSDVQSFIDENLGRFRSELYEFLRIPSVSAKSEHDGDTRAAAQWFAEKLTNAGLTPEIVDTPGHPIVVGESHAAGPDAPTVLIYGHYDVQPPEPLDLWASPPFEPTERDGRVYARGSADDKGQLYMHVKALEAFHATGTPLPLNVVMIAEGEEEVGSPNLVPFVVEHAERLACDVVLISDTGMYAEGLPSVGFSLRGLAYFEVHVHGANSDLHSGEFGGAVANPANTLSKIIASLHAADGSIAIDGFYDDVLQWDDATRAQIASLPHSDGEFAGDLDLDELTGEAGYGTLERLWIRPTCDVCGILSGYTGEGAKTVLPNHAMAKVSFRLVPDQNPDRIKALLDAHVASLDLPGVTVEVRELHGGRPWRASIEGPAFEAASAALEEAFGTKPVPMGGGGSIPIVVEFEEKLDATALLVGFSLPGCNLHAPNEWMSIDNYEKGIGALARLYQKLGEAGTAS
jgi:acetylornithine deacetylase/succinyl-diaminopimelate desuccinylase-like protein